ncbi:biotin carboxyl carrier protein [Flavobacteriaceae bacterium MAR_2010_188]|nr:biotin carboxyl carrier protein [Flavobacteriaceae bacterium MAR_2010_188]
MKETYRVVVDAEHEFDLSSKDAEQLDIIPNKNGKSHLLVENTSYQTEILDSDFNNNNYTIKINGRKFKVEIHTALDALIDKMGLTVATEKNVNQLIAPMPGLILNINVKVKDEVKENEPLLVLEAMKMENVMVAPRNGTIKSISVNKGQTVNKNDLLIEFE